MASNLRRKHRAYHWRKAVPEELRERLERREWVRSLGRISFHDAMRSARAVSCAADRLIYIPMSTPSLTQGQLEDLARKWFAEALQDAEARLRATPPPAWEDDEDDPIGERDEQLAMFQSDAREAFARNDIRIVEKSAEGLLEEAGLQSADQDTRRSLGRLLLRAHVEALRHERSWALGDYSIRPEDKLFEAPPAGAAVAGTVPGASGPTLTGLFDAYVQDRMQGGHWAPETQGKAPRTLRSFVDYYPEGKLAEDVDRASIKDWIAELMVDQDLAASTVALRLRMVRAMFAWGLLEEQISKAPQFRGLSPKPDEPGREAYSSDDLRLIFNSPIYTGRGENAWLSISGSKLVADDRFWIPLIALHAGLRPREIGNLKGTDIRLEKGVWCFDVYETKTKAGTRLVPLHPRLIEIGLVEAAQDAGDGFLLPDLVMTSSGDRSTRIKKWWPSFLDRLGIRRPGLTLYSFRATFITSLINATSEVTFAKLIAGHKMQDVTGKHYARMSPRQRLDRIEKLDFGVDLSHLNGFYTRALEQEAAIRAANSLTSAISSSSK